MLAKINFIVQVADSSYNVMSISNMKVGLRIIVQGKINNDDILSTRSLSPSMI